MDTIKKECMFCEKEYECIYDEKNLCDDCIEIVCNKISKKYSKELFKAFVSFNKTSLKQDMPYVFGSVNFFANQKFFVPIILCGNSIQFHNSENDRNKIIEKVIGINC